MNKLAQILCVTGLAAVSLMAAESKAKSYEGPWRCVVEKRVGAKLSEDRIPVNFRLEGEEFRVLDRESLFSSLKAAGFHDVDDFLDYGSMYVRAVDQDPKNPFVWTPLRKLSGDGHYKTSEEVLPLSGTPNIEINLESGRFQHTIFGGWVRDGSEGGDPAFAFGTCRPYYD